jgi:hypothetical protein
MKQLKILFAIVGLTACISGVNAQTYDEIDGYVSNSSIVSVADLPIVREINGGTVFNVQYSGNWTAEMKGAFEYACKIVEEIIPPCLPITVKAEIGSLSSSSTNVQLSKVYIRSYTDMDEIYSNHKALGSQIKGVIFGEYEQHGAFVQFYKDIDSTDFFDSFTTPDIRIVYNQSKLKDLSYSIAECPEDKYDFVSVVIRDLLHGLGFSNSYKLDTASNQIDLLKTYKTTFERITSYALYGNDLNQDPYVYSTSGEVKLYTSGDKELNLYAPNPWQDGVSLNYFIPSDDYKLSTALTYNFGKGTVVRDLSDPAFKSFFTKLLGWELNYTVSSSSTSESIDGSTENVIPYQGEYSVTFADKTFDSSSITYETVADIDASEITDDERRSMLWDYCLPYHCFYHGGTSLGYGVDGDGWTVSVLKKDGTWDCVYHNTLAYDELAFSYDNLKFNCDDNEYARTADGYLRCRITRSYRVSVPNGEARRCYNAHYYVMGCLPQKVELSRAYQDSNVAQPLASSTTTAIKLGMKNLEGVTRLVLEVKPTGARVPSKVEVTDFASGVVDLQLTSGKISTITPVAYNDNGETRGEAFTVDLTEE